MLHRFPPAMEEVQLLRVQPGSGASKPEILASNTYAATPAWNLPNLRGVPGQITGSVHPADRLRSPQERRINTIVVQLLASDASDFFLESTH